MIAVGFTPDLLDLTLEQKTEICNQLTQNPNPDNLGEILYSLGFRNNNGKISFVKKNVVYEVNQQELIQGFRYCFSGQLPQLKAAFFGRIGTLTNQTALKHIAGYDPEIDGYPCRHDRYHFYTPYLNGVLKVDGKGYINLIPYEGFNMLVNASEIRPRPVLVTDETVKESYWQRSDFWKFTKNQATDPISKSFDPDLHEAIRMAVVKIMHQYHNVNDPSIVIFSEQKRQDEVNAGGTGKGILIDAIENIVGKAAKIEGKNFDLRYAHNLQNVKPDTRFIWLDEPDKVEDALNAFYSGTTGDMVINPKNKDSFTIPKEHLPKIVFTTNSPGYGVNDSDLRRRFDVPLTRWYTYQHQPDKDFDRVLFGPDWTEDDWNMFDNLIACWCAEFLQKGYASHRLKRCKKADDLLREAALQEIPQHLREFFEDSFGDQIEAGVEFRLRTSLVHANYTPSPRSFPITFKNFCGMLAKWFKQSNCLVLSGDDLRGYDEDGKRYRYWTVKPQATAKGEAQTDVGTTPSIPPMIELKIVTDDRSA